MRAAGRPTRIPRAASTSPPRCRRIGRRPWNTRPGRAPTCRRSVSRIRSASTWRASRGAAMHISNRLALFGVAVGIVLGATVVVVWPRAAGSQENTAIAALRARAAVLEREIGLLEDTNAVKRLQRVYGFYTDKQLWTQAAD